MMRKYLQFLCLLFAISTFAQTKYFEFRTNSKIGLVDSSGEEIVPASFQYSNSYKDNKAFVFKDYDKDVYLFFSADTKKKQTYASIYTNLIYIKNKAYLLAKKKDKSYLISIDYGSEMPLKDEFYSLQNNGNYLIGIYTPSTEISKPIVAEKKTTGQGSKVKALPSIEPIKSLVQDKFIIMKDDGSFTPIFNAVSDKFVVLYDLNKSNDDGLARDESVNLDDRSRKAFDYLLLRDITASKANLWTIYDSKLKKLKSFGESFSEDEALATAEKLLGKTLSTSSFAVPPSMGIGSSASAEKINYPSLLKETVNGENVVYFLKSETEKIKLFSTPLEVELSPRSFDVTVEKNDDDAAVFVVDENTNKVLFPKKYWEKYKMK
ncbi:hypothetical protein [Soonwooa sp.]|uniref:hypothetical protein n=1 Tax=Soonwooa sp. TaxID=1938592 RepID=UPI002606CD67|nr:hypothetical protein [Soonwooa sp.]